MIKLMLMFKRKEGLTPEEFKQYWIEKHTPLVLKAFPEETAPFKYVHNYGIHMEGLGEPDYDGVGSLYFENEQSFLKSKEWLSSEEGKKIRDDETNFINTDSMISMAVDERIIIPEKSSSAGDNDMLKLVCLLKRKNGITPEEFSKHWFGVHADIAKKVMPDTVRVRKYFQNHVVRLGQDEEPPCDGVVEFCIEGMDSLMAWMTFYSTNEGAAIRDDEVKFIDVDKMVVAITEESVIK